MDKSKCPPPLPDIIKFGWDRLEGVDSSSEDIKTLLPASPEERPHHPGFIQPDVLGFMLQFSFHICLCSNVLGCCQWIMAIIGYLTWEHIGLPYKFIVVYV